MHTLRSITVTKLFGRYNYTLPTTSQLLDDVNILYGQNGAGKTTLLSLVFHLLSPSENAGHRGRIAETPFYQLTVTLHDGTTLSAAKDPQLLVGPVDFRISSPRSEPIVWRFIPGAPLSIKYEDLPKTIDLNKLPDEMREQVAGALDRRRFFEELRRLDLKVFMLTSDRILLGDSVRDTVRTDPRPDSPRARARLAEMVVEHRVAAVTEALNAAAAWIRTKFLERTYGPYESSTNLYLDVAKRIAKSTYRTKAGLSTAQQTKTIAALEQSIRELERQSLDFQRYGLALSVVSPELLNVIQGAKGNRLQLLSTILEPHLASVRARYENLRPLYIIADTFVSTLNKFFKDKKIEYSVRNGLKIVVADTANAAQEIAPAQLSSGEQQLLLLFCHVLTTRDSPNIFIIDEPELSLNIVWQRMLVASMLEVAKGSELQLVLASHSMEIIAKHRDRVVSMQEA